MSKRKNLEDALKRLIDGKPKNIDKKRKITPCSVEDEAKVSRSLLRTEIYSDIFEDTIKEKEKQKKKIKAQKNGSVQNPTSVNQDIRDLNTEIKDNKDEIRDLKESNDKLMQTNAELFSLLISIAQDARLKKQLEEAVNSTTNVNISKALTELLRK